MIGLVVARITNPFLSTIMVIGRAQAAVEHLLMLGRRKIGRIGGLLQVTSGRQRLEGYLLLALRSIRVGFGLPITGPVAEWQNQEVTFALEQDAALLPSGAIYLDGRQTALCLV